MLDYQGEELPKMLIPMNRFGLAISNTKTKLRSISHTLTSEIRERFHKDDLLEEMGIVNPLF